MHFSRALTHRLSIFGGTHVQQQQQQPIIIYTTRQKCFRPRHAETALSTTRLKFVFNDISCQLRFIAIQYIITPLRFIGAITIINTYFLFSIFPRIKYHIPVHIITNILLILRRRKLLLPANRHHIDLPILLSCCSRRWHFHPATHVRPPLHTFFTGRVHRTPHLCFSLRTQKSYLNLVTIL